MTLYRSMPIAFLALAYSACAPATEAALPPGSNTAAIEVQTAPIVQIQAAPVIPQRRPMRHAFTTKRCINLGNAMESPNEGEWGYTIRRRDFATIKAGGFDTVRIPMRWDTHMQSRAPYTVEPAFMARAGEVVRWAQQAGLSVIIDVHHFEDLMDNTARETPRYLALWDQIALYFKDAPQSVTFELLNEPTKDMSMETLNALYARLIPRIRKTNPSRTLIMGGNWWNSLESLSQINWPKNDPNIIATYHDYGPHEFTHQGASWIEPPMPIGRIWGDAEDRAELTNTLAEARRFAQSSPMPIFVGEFGVINTVPAAQRNAWMKARRKAMEKAGYSWCVWDYSGAFSLYDMDKERWKSGALKALTGR